MAPILSLLSLFHAYAHNTHMCVFILEHIMTLAFTILDHSLFLSHTHIHVYIHNRSIQLIHKQIMLTHKSTYVFFTSQNQTTLLLIINIIHTSNLVNIENSLSSKNSNFHNMFYLYIENLDQRS